MRTPPGFVLLGAITAALACAHAAASGVTYKYREDDGTVWFTDQRPSGETIDRYEFLGYRGRPPASSSCNITATKIQERANRIATPLRRYAVRFSVDEALVRAMVRVESCFDPQAVSRVGAQGLMQLMPATARALEVSHPFDVLENLRGGIEYFASLQSRYEDPELALAAYNAGPGAVARHDGIPPYPETQDYVRRVLEYWRAPE
ncbi:MAG: lytic transglycosylase domain-containing protein [Halofilum sp. (in: g-proteobacteria)]